MIGLTKDRKGENKTTWIYFYGSYITDISLLTRYISRQYYGSKNKETETVLNILKTEEVQLKTLIEC